ncbi:MAG: hypothetical protein AAFU85_30180, partial [Planctomycetota bacterium]
MPCSVEGERAGRVNGLATFRLGPIGERLRQIGGRRNQLSTLPRPSRVFAITSDRSHAAMLLPVPSRR